MDWYRVVKTIKGRRYAYLQKTYRSGGRVHTISKYIGPTGRTVRADGSVNSGTPPPPREKRKSKGAERIASSESATRSARFLQSEVRTLYRGGGTGSMPSGLSASDIIRYEIDELGNNIQITAGMDLSGVRSEDLMWLTETRQAARQYGSAGVVTGRFRIIARDSYKGVLVEKVSDEACDTGRSVNYIPPKRMKRFSKKKRMARDGKRSHHV